MFGNSNNNGRISQSIIRTEKVISNLKVRLFYVLLALCVIVTVLVWYNSDTSVIVYSPKNRNIHQEKKPYDDNFVQLHLEDLNTTNVHRFHQLSLDAKKAIVTATPSKTLGGLAEEALDSSSGKEWATKRHPSDDISTHKQREDGALLVMAHMTGNATKVDPVIGKGNTSDKNNPEGTDKYLIPPSTKAHSQPPDYKQCTSLIDTSCMYGRCITGTNHILLYNRVPKCGSRTFLSLAQVLAAKNGFHEPRDATGANSGKKKWKDSKPVDGVTMKATLLRRLKNMPLGSLLHGHINFIDFNNDTRLSEKKRPIYLNIIRDPIDRLVSQYYFVRYGDKKFTNKMRLRKFQKNKFLNETFNDCVERDRPECHGSIAQVKFLCGYHPDCRYPEEALQRAMRNLDLYLVVGVTEEYEDFLKVLEKLLPDYFRGVVDEYNTPADKIRQEKTSALKKQLPTEAVREKMRALLDIEYKFYNHVRLKFQGLKQKFGIG